LQQAQQASVTQPAWLAGAALHPGPSVPEQWAERGEGDGQARLHADGQGKLRHRAPEGPPETCTIALQPLKWAFLIKHYPEVDFKC